MTKNASFLIIFSIFSCLWLLAAFTPVHGAGSREGDLSKADKLIENKEYDEAILFLTNYARHNPDKFDEAQVRLNKIYKVREEFNRTADLLIETLLDDPENSEKILELTTKLRSLENENNPVLITFLTQNHEIALFNVSRLRLRRILERGRALIDSGDFEGALSVYSGGFEIMREEFYNSDYESAVLNQARQETDNVNSIIASFHQVSNDLESASAELARAVNSAYHARIPEIMNRLVPAMDRFIAQKQIVYASLAVFEQMLLDIQRENPEMQDRNHLAFVNWVITGRTDEIIPEGILGVFDNFWDKSAGSSLNAITQYIETANNASLASFNKKDYASSISALADIAGYNDVTPVFFDKKRQLIPLPSLFAVFNNNIVLKKNLEQFLKLYSLYESASAIERASYIASAEQIDRTALTNLRNNRITAPEAFAIEINTRNILNNQQKEIEEIKQRAAMADTQISAIHIFPYLKNTIDALDGLLSAINAEEQQSAQRYYNIAQSDLEYQLAERKSQLERGRMLLDGRSRTTPEGVTVLSRYPAEALQELTPMLDSVSGDINRGNSLLAELRNEPPGIASGNEIRNLTASYQAAVNELANVQSQGQNMAQIARNNSLQADALRQEGERIFSEAQFSFQRQDYEIARERLERASGRLDESLALQESEAVREFRNSLILNLGQQIAMAQNETIILQVRDLVNTARDFYFAGNFYQAEDNLLRARNRWRLVSTEENTEVVYWLNMVSRAMSASSARVIPATAPLYPEVSQLLSQAYRNYEEGMRLINAGNRAQGIAKFDEARAQTREVKLMFPVNQEAGILDLRMEQFIDPRAFNAEFEARLRRAIAGTQPPLSSLESYGDLLNLAEINPNYPGIRNIIFQAEVDMGIRPPPPNPADIARSRELTALAARILEQRVTDQIPIALVQINEAITLDPNNQDAPRIKDQLLNMSNTTETGTVVLSSEDENRYQLAVREFQSGNNLLAYAHIERILQNPRNRNVAKVVDLQRRIQAAL